MSEVGVKDSAAWVLAEGADGAMPSRSVPIDKIMDDAFVAYAQNGEADPAREWLPDAGWIPPGWEGANINVSAGFETSRLGDKPFHDPGRDGRRNIPTSSPLPARRGNSPG